MADGLITLIRRQETLSLATSTVTNAPAHCTPFTLPSNGIIRFEEMAVTLTRNVEFDPQCTVIAPATPIGNLKDEFYASITPLTYVIAAATVIAWILVIMLTVTPRTAFIGGLSGSPPGFVNAHGIISGASGGGATLGGAGSRPWLQKVAALAVAISLTIATSDTFTVANRQYEIGFTNAGALHTEVFGSTEIRVMRVISDIFLWLAQVQTLIRLFPRHKEKVLIKWIGFALILFDTVFSCLNLFWVPATRFDDAIPTLSYLFELALGLLYAAWVLYYSLTKRRYAFYHYKMRNIALIALLSVVAILTPVIFFITDIVNQNIAGWGDYIRWVGQAAASVVVWEWVERIEALEADEKKDGILGREVFDGDEMLDITPSEDVVWANGSHRRDSARSRRGQRDVEGARRGTLDHGLSHITHRFRSRQLPISQHFPLGRTHSYTEPRSDDRESDPRGTDSVNPTASAYRDGMTESVSPVQQAPTVLGSSTDTTSAASTVYVVRHRAAENVPQHVKRFRFPLGRTQTLQLRPSGRVTEMSKSDVDIDENEVQTPRDQSRWHAVSNPFKRKRTLPPQEVQQAREAAAAAAAMPPTQPGILATPNAAFSSWDMKDRSDSQNLNGHGRRRVGGSSRQRGANIPITVIPAQPRANRTAATPPSTLPRSTTVQSSTTIPHPSLNRIQSNSGPSPATHQDPSPTTQIDDPASTSPSPTNQPHSSPSLVRSSSLFSSWASSPSPSTQDGPPPRADEVSQFSRSGNGSVVIPAPPRRSPFKPAPSPTPPARGALARPGPPPQIPPSHASSSQRAPSSL